MSSISPRGIGAGSGIRFSSAAAASGGNDAFVKLLLHCDGADTTTTFTDDSPSARGNATVGGNAQVDTAQSVFGGASALFDGTGDYLQYANSTDWNLGAAGSGDFTLDFRLRFNGTPAIASLISAGDLSGTGWTLYWASNTLRIYDSSDKTVSWTPSASTWYHVAVARETSTIRVFIDGTSIGNLSGDVDMNNDSQAFRVASDNPGFFQLNGWMDEIRISKGIARWTANFTPPSAAYSADAKIKQFMHHYKTMAAS